MRYQDSLNRTFAHASEIFIFGVNCVLGSVLHPLNLWWQENYTFSLVTNLEFWCMTTWSSLHSPMFHLNDNNEKKLLPYTRFICLLIVSVWVSFYKRGWQKIVRTGLEVALATPLIKRNFASNHIKSFPFGMIIDVITMRCNYDAMQCVQN